MVVRGHGTAGASGGAAWRAVGEDIELRVKVSPRASQDRVTGIEDGRVRLRVTAAPVDGEANRRIVALLAAAFGVAKSRVEILSGATGREKVVRVRAPRRRPDWLEAVAPSARDAT